MFVVRLRYLVAVEVLAALLVAASLGQVTTGGQSDRHRHPVVGLMVVSFPGAE